MKLEKREKHMATMYVIMKIVGDYFVDASYTNKVAERKMRYKYLLMGVEWQRREMDIIIKLTDNYISRIAPEDLWERKAIVGFLPDKYGGRVLFKTEKHTLQVAFNKKMRKRRFKCSVLTPIRQRAKNGIAKPH